MIAENPLTQIRSATSTLPDLPQYQESEQSLGKEGSVWSSTRHRVTASLSTSVLDPFTSGVFMLNVFGLMGTKKKDNEVLWGKKKNTSTDINRLSNQNQDLL